MFGSGYKAQKLKVNLRLSINRLKLLEKKKTELALKARREISEYIASAKYDRARIRVESIIKEDYLVEAMELIEMYCDLLLARYGLIETQKQVDPGLEEAMASVIWATPRVADVQELKEVKTQLAAKYGKEFAEECATNQHGKVNSRLVNKLAVEPPPRMLVERYMVEIARNFHVPFEPDPDVLGDTEGIPSEFEGFGGASGGGDGGMRSPSMPYPQQTSPQGYHPGYQQNAMPGPPPPAAIYNPNTPQSPPAGGQPRPDVMEDGLPVLPSVPGNSAAAPPGKTVGGDSVDFDDLTRRFEELKRRK